MLWVAGRRHRLALGESTRLADLQKTLNKLCWVTAEQNHAVEYAYLSQVLVGNRRYTQVRII